MYRRMKDTVVDKVLPQDRQTQPSDEILTRSIYTPINHQLALETETCEYTQIETSRKRYVFVWQIRIDHFQNIQEIS